MRDTRSPWTRKHRRIRTNQGARLMTVATISPIILPLESATNAIAVAVAKAT